MNAYNLYLLGRLTGIRDEMEQRIETSRGEMKDFYLTRLKACEELMTEIEANRDVSSFNYIYLRADDWAYMLQLAPVKQRMQFNAGR